MNRRETSVGFNLTYEFDNTVDKARHEQSLFNMKLNKIENKSLLNSVKADVENLSEQIVVQKKRVSILEKQSKVTERLIKGEKKRFKRGLLNLRDLIITQNNYTQVQYDLIQQKVNLAKLIINWKQLEDTLIEKI